jgi:hypothetical protein
VDESCNAEATVGSSSSSFFRGTKAGKSRPKPFFIKFEQYMEVEENPK